MAGLTVFGGSGYAGSHIVEAAAVRGLDVSSITRHEVATQIANVHYQTGNLADPEVRAHALANADTVIVAASPRGDMADSLRELIRQFALEADAAGVRFGVIGGSGSLLNQENGTALCELPEFGDEFRPEAQTMAAVLDDLRAAPESLDWFLVSPPADFGPWVAGSYVGEYRVGGDVLLVDDNGKSAISGADFGVAVIDEVESPTQHRARFTVAY